MDTASTRSITLDHPTFRAAVAELRLAADRLHDDRDRVSRQVDDLLDRTWCGAAASAYAEAWADWNCAAETVVRGLTAMGDLLEAAHADLLGSDLDSQASLGQV